MPHASGVRVVGLNRRQKIARRGEAIFRTCGQGAFPDGVLETSGGPADIRSSPEIDGAVPEVTAASDVTAEKAPVQSNEDVDSEIESILSDAEALEVE